MTEQMIVVALLVILTALIAVWVYFIRAVLGRCLPEEERRFAFRLAAALTTAVLVLFLVYMSSIPAVSEFGEPSRRREHSQHHVIP